MSNSATAPTSTTASSPHSASNAPPSPTCTEFAGYRDGHNGRDNPRNPVHLAPQAVEVVACGALAAHIRAIAARRGWPVTVRPVPAALHNRPEKIKDHSERLLATPNAPNSRQLLAYADCGTYGALDHLAKERGIPRLPGLHCYDLYAGKEKIDHLFKEEPGTYLLTDYLIKSFERAVIKPLGLDRHPELWPDYFAHYTRLVWLAQSPTSKLEEAATEIASQFNLPLTRIDTGTSLLEAALSQAIEPLHDS